MEDFELSIGKHKIIARSMVNKHFDDWIKLSISDGEHEFEIGEDRKHTFISKFITGLNGKYDEIKGHIQGYPCTGVLTVDETRTTIYMAHKESATLLLFQSAKGEAIQIIEATKSEFDSLIDQLNLLLLPH
ncbi:MAG: hypothetical protein OI74_05260 [Gammaproteobacteria bacterium (ex Lamellibrachia satsuma)]|nr:MAG: hypothetical protein HPY30_02995 [Gammaproteobacteria bacterium (ex Lamellibrachia satsuma)]RRS34615.1 MAG: hypothetical protein OI74_05260 [Gammaproteobacteria bacterium (ex Lamellibrachia satsuma)]RRS37393.1 MAG: hypothetical protein NV67_01045 [Gammaproteobacteria bacterium (ex Lamellibrachia satsuma)]